MVKVLKIMGEYKTGTIGWIYEALFDRQENFNLLNYSRSEGRTCWRVPRACLYIRAAGDQGSFAVNRRVNG